MAAGTDGIDKLGGYLQKILESNREFQEDFRDYLSDTRVLGSRAEGDLRRERSVIQQRIKRYQDEAQQAVRLQKKLEELAHAAETGDDTMMDLSRQAQEVINQFTELTDKNNSLTEGQKDQLNTLRASIIAGNLNNNEIRKTITTVGDFGREQLQASDRLQILHKNTGRLTLGFIEATKAAKEWAAATFSYGTALSMLLNGVRLSFEQIEYSLQQQVPIHDSLAAGVTKSAAAYGVSTKVLMETQNEYSQALIAAAGPVRNLSDVSANTLETFKRLRESAYNLTGSFDEALKLTAVGIDTLRRQGVRMSADEMVSQMEGPDGIFASLKGLAAVTNKSGDEILKLNAAQMEDQYLRMQLLGLSEEQRKLQMKEMLQSQEYLVQKGLEIGAAIEATAALKKMTTQMDPRERLKQAAKIRAVAGAMGVEGGEEMMQIMMKANKTPEDIRKLNEFGTNFQSAVGQRMGGDFASQTYGFAMQQAAGGEVLNNLYGLSSAGREGTAVPPELMEAAKRQENQLSGIQEVLKETKQVSERIMAFTRDSSVFLTGAAAIGIGKLVVDVMRIRAAIGAGGTDLAGAGVGKGGWKSGTRAAKLAKFGGVAALGGGLIAGGMEVAAGNAAGGYGQMAGSVVGAGLGALGGPVGMMIGTTIGGIVGEKLGEITGKWLSSDNKMSAVQEEFNKARDQYLEEMKKQSDPAIQMLVEALEKNNELTESQQALLKEQVEVAKQNIAETKKNTEQTAQNTGELGKEKGNCKPYMLRRAPAL